MLYSADANNNSRSDATCLTKIRKNKKNIVALTVWDGIVRTENLRLKGHAKIDGEIVKSGLSTNQAYHVRNAGYRIRRW